MSKDKKNALIPDTTGGDIIEVYAPFKPLYPKIKLPQDLDESLLPDVKPVFIGQLYTVCDFPYEWHDLSVDGDNIYNGAVNEDNVGNLKMQWNGCVSRMYDGTLILVMISEDSFVKGENVHGPFHISREKLETGIPPACIRVHCRELQSKDD